MFEKLNAMRLWDFKVDFLRTDPDLGDNVLRILGSTDFSYYHLAEIRFFNTSAISCPMSFHHAHFDEASFEESELLFQRGLLVQGGKAFRITADVGNETFERSHYIVASHTVVTLEKVYYFRKENLGPNERLADWVT